jgi:quinoprotein relay system zinc metallohydrolase 2
MAVVERGRYSTGALRRVSLTAMAALAAMTASAVVVVQSAAAHAATGFDLGQARPGVYLHPGREVALDAPGHDDIANLGFVVGEKCVAVIDTGGSIATGRALRASIKRRTALPICYVINTHVHVDHVLGNAAFNDDRPHFVGHSALAAAMARSKEFFLTEYAGDFDAPPTAAQVIGPDRLVEHAATLDLGNRILELHAWPTAHTDCDLTVYDVKTRTLFTGDLLFRERMPVLDGSVKGWLAALEELERLDVLLAIPGHGPSARELAAAVVPERRYLHVLVDGIRAELANGKSMQDAIAQVGDSEKHAWLLWENVHAHNVARAYEELEWE